jgi:hypothetical protein
MCLESHFTSISGMGGSILSKKSKSLYPNMAGSYRTAQGGLLNGNPILYVLPNNLARQKQPYTSVPMDAEVFRSYAALKFECWLSKRRIFLAGA